MIRKNILLVVLLFFFAACQVDVLVGTEEDPPPTPEVSMEALNIDVFEFFSQDSIYYNWNAACTLLSPWIEKIYEFADIIDCYSDLNERNITFFAGDTWFRKNDSAALYLTYEPGNIVFCELFVHPDQKKSGQRILWGRYETDLSSGSFVLNNGNDSIMLLWSYDNDYTYKFFRYDNYDILKIEAFWPNYSYFLYQKEDTATISFVDVANFGRVKAYKFFKDSLWHCWDDEFVNTTCYY